ncbi:MAG TPA: Arm DNA-binding domain-containing protein, partial [Chryseolinea sp.]|nr:Arm DNA-binding domain-containing protein [Chryseolinea sp.]
MEKRVTYSTAFLLRSSKGNNHEALIYCRITVDMQRTEFSIKRKVRKELWNNGQAKNNSEEGKTVNAYIKQVESQIFQYYRDMLADRKLITAEALKNAYLGILADEQSLMSLVDYH